MTLVTGVYKDWFRNPESSPGMLPHLEHSGGPTGGLENVIRFDLSTTASLQRVAYSNLKLGGLRGAGRASVSMRFDESIFGPTVAADRTKVGVLTRWNPAHLDAVDAGYVAEIEYTVDRVISGGGSGTTLLYTVTAANGNFQSNDVGRSLVLVGAGYFGGDYVGAITGVISTTQITVHSPIITTVVNAPLFLADMTCSLRNGPDESGEIIFEHRLNPTFGFVRGQWIEVGLDMSIDTVGNLKLLVLARLNPQRGVNTLYATYGIDTDTWYRVDSVMIPRHVAYGSGESGWQILTRAGVGSLRIGSYRAKVDASLALDLLPDIITV